MRRNLVTAACVMAIATACAPAAATHDTAADVAAIGKVRDGYAAAFKSGNATALAAMYTADAHSMNNAQPTAMGAQSIEAATKALFEQMTPTDIVITSEKTDVSGDMAYDRGMYKNTVTPKAGGAPMVEEGRYLVVLKRQADGSWKLAEEMGNLPTAPMAMPTPPPAKK